MTEEWREQREPRMGGNRSERSRLVSLLVPFTRLVCSFPTITLIPSIMNETRSEPKRERKWRENDGGVRRERVTGTDQTSR